MPDVTETDALVKTTKLLDQLAKPEQERVVRYLGDRYLPPQSPGEAE